MNSQDVVVVIPGITGSVLEKPDGERWALSGSAVAKALASGGSSLFDLQLVNDDPSQPHAPDGVRATRLLDDFHILPGLWRVDGYSTLEKRLRTRFKLVEGENLRVFPYDWRRDNRAASHRLHQESQVWLAEQRARGATNPKLVIVAHSMGGLVARYFLECLQGWKQTRHLVTFGTPYRGSLNAVDSIANGVRKAFINLTPVTDMVRSFASVHQLLPIYPCIDDGSGAWRRIRELDGGLPGANPTLLDDAISFHDEIAAAQATNAQLAEYHDENHGYGLHAVVGTEQSTAQSARRDGDQFHMSKDQGGQDLRGDGTVPYVSSFPLEWADATRGKFVASKHASMHNRPDGLAQIEGILRGSAIDLTAYRDGIDDWIALDNDDLYAAGDVEIVTRTSSAAAPTAVLESLDEQPDIVGEVRSSTQAENGVAHDFVFRNVPAGAWRLDCETPAASGSDSLLVV